MRPPAIRVEALSKRYEIGAAVRYQTLRDTITNLVAAPIRRFQGRRRVTTETLWALKDVSFDVQPGEIIGIIGSNGAGKSTLLKILSHISDPTEGRVEIRGRVASLLEVGTGFHLELTGRENIFLNGAILGMHRREIRSKFDQIVEFSGVSRFLDTPVKRFSTGMTVRLAFAVAAHLEPEVLLVDEVLAVGDAEFQEKCLGKMENVAGEGRTVLFVSHNLSAVSRFCQRGIYLREGRFISSGPIPEILELYRQDMASVAGSGKKAPRELRIVSVGVTGPESNEKGVFGPFDPCVVRIVFDAAVALESVVVDVRVQDAQGRKCIQVRTRADRDDLAVGRGRHVVEARIESLNLEGQIYFLSVRVASRNPALRSDSKSLTLDVRAPWVAQPGRAAPVVAVKHQWSVGTLSDAEKDVGAAM